MLYQQNERKYLNSDERLQFHETAEQIFDLRRFCFCQLLLITGCRISEALNLRVRDIDFNQGLVFFRTLKQRKKDIYRPHPIDGSELLDDLQSLIKEKDLSGDVKLWSVCRTTGWNWIKKVMEKANITGIKATPKGLRHGFGIFCAQKKYTLDRISKLMGHVKRETTEIYLDFVGPDLNEMISDTWKFFEKAKNRLPKPTGNVRDINELNNIVHSVQDLGFLGFSYYKMNYFSGFCRSF